MRFLKSLFGSRTPRKRSNQPKPRRFELLEKREMMAVTPLYYSAALSPAAIDEVNVSGLVSRTDPIPVPAFSSLPGAPATLYLDFDGHFQDVAAISGHPNLLSPAFAIDSDGTNWDAEFFVIREIWARVAEDYAPFNINVTTVKPTDFSENALVLRVVITGEDFRSDKDQGGVAHVGAFDDPDTPNVVYVFSKSKGFDAETDPAGLRATASIANLASHEAGHAFGLEHQSVFTNGKLVEEYNPGDAEKAPIMGNANGSQRGVWWEGTNADGVFQRDVNIIGSSINGFGFRSDENNISFAEPEQLRATEQGYAGQGIINSVSDVDVFRFDTQGGRVAVSLDGARVEGFFGEVSIGNLDAIVELYNNQGELLLRDAAVNSHFAAVDAPNLAAGNYFVKVLSQGMPGDLGQYSVVVQEFAPPRVISTSYVELSATLAGVWVQFSKPIQASTFTTADVSVDGVSVQGVTVDPNDASRYLVTVTRPTGYYWTLGIGPDIRDSFGFKMDQNNNGVQGEATDVYRGIFLGPSVPTWQLSTTNPTGSRKTKLSPALVDAALVL
jgi:hypothetical protein